MPESPTSPVLNPASVLGGSVGESTIQDLTRIVEGLNARVKVLEDGFPDELVLTVESGDE